MKADITFGRSELQEIILQLSTLFGKIAGVKLAAQTINLSEIDPDALIGVLEDLEANGSQILEKLNKKYYPQSEQS